jgi:hypothetical protein
MNGIRHIYTMIGLVNVNETCGEDNDHLVYYDMYYQSEQEH